jgi:hypothetical protein
MNSSNKESEMQVLVNDVVKSYDFPGILDYYMVGIVTAVEDDMLVCKTIKIVQEGKAVDYGCRTPSEFRTPMQGSMMMDDRFERVVVVG